MWKQRLLGVALVAHGLAHAGPGIWASGRGPVEPLAFLWWIATIGFILAGFRCLDWPAPRVHPLVVIVPAAAASLALLPFLGLGWVALGGAVLNLALVQIVRRCTRDAPLAWLADAPCQPRSVGEPSTRHPVRHQAALVLASLFLLHLSASILLRPWHTTWGTTVAERRAALPGDELIPDARYVMDHAIVIDAPADSVWPWLVQIGQDRGGFYSYDWLERLIGDDVHNADWIVPDWQRLAVGDLVRAVQPDYLGGRLGRDIGWRVARIDPGRALVLENWGSFVLHPVNGSRCILHVRTRGAGQPSVAALPLAPLGLLLFEPAHFLMERGMLLGIRKRAERMGD
ncbi:MAG TPA: hypothetical protein VLE53_04665 [Gemmatimonadaceae bacterium]|nr:hypothetical protein [Gemmatimonadaceae bacterium]